jgi:hypothetical protein
VQSSVHCRRSWANNHAGIATSTAKITAIGAVSSSFAPLRPASGNPVRCYNR